MPPVGTRVRASLLRVGEREVHGLEGLPRFEQLGALGGELRDLTREGVRSVSAATSDLRATSSSARDSSSSLAIRSSSERLSASSWSFFASALRRVSCSFP